MIIKFGTGSVTGVGNNPCDHWFIVNKIER